MISCYFILLMKTHKKQNGQLASPFIPPDWLFLSGRRGHSLGQVGLASSGLPAHPCPLAGISGSSPWAILFPNAGDP